MKLMYSRWGMCAIILVSLMMTTKVCGKRPETILAEVLAKPFAPHEFASPECIRDSKYYLEALEKYTPWALQMYDASIKIPYGVITGNYKQLGNFDECLHVKNEHGFIGQACNVAVEFDIAADNGTLDRELDLGDLFVNVANASNAIKWTSGKTVEYTGMWCIPSTCNHMEIEEALEIAFDSLRVEGRVDMIIKVPKESCHTIESINLSWDYADYCYILILALFALLIVSNTMYEMAGQWGFIKSKPKVIFTVFSLYTNGKNLLKTDRRKDSIGCIDGIRFISLCWIIYGHTYFMEAVGVKINLAQIPRMHYEWNNMLVLNGNIVTDTFFLLSSTLLSYTELLKKKRNVSIQKETKWHFDLVGLYSHRYIRLTPAYAMMIGFYATLFYKLGSGLNWDTWVGSNVNFCRENWWTNLLYINNLVNVPNMCMSQSWYLATDMQLVWLSPLVLYPMLKFRSCFFILILIIYFISSIIVPFVITYLHGLTGTMLYYKDQMDVAQVYLEIYIKVYSRFGPYIIGLGLGYILYKTRSNPVKLRVWQVICGWLIAILIGLSSVFGPRGMYFEDHVYNVLEASFYAGFHRQIFALSVSWIIFCCVNGYAGPVNHFLSWSGWIPLSKLCYCAYLCHYIFLLAENGAARTTGNLTQINMLRAFSANLVFTMVCSALWSLCFEIPFMNIDRIFLSGKQKSSKNKNGKSTFDNESSQSKEDPSTTTSVDFITVCDNWENGYCKPTIIAGKTRENDVEHEKIKKSFSNIYFISSTECDDLYNNMYGREY
ncbi:nose resistant to fluoxetine protein 6-like [Nylanderia fulva]|uniref:nose resistant to fluoxetine protein 6-like n=1 Tax=Nylanderia fulva TaxID=613905 RepID=UPI0010FBBD84|nr:nose resistant to fluoxetine protein 6-like [Nylanderia fulva]XP_029174812.1 nose resistant to fluoxetine protein 6-like [Nylanderia fulva]